jgi:sodium/hydrogen exchanger 8
LAEEPASELTTTISAAVCPINFYQHCRHYPTSCSHLLPPLSSPSNQGWSTSQEGVASYFFVFLTLLCIALVITSKLETTKHHLSSVPYTTLSFLQRIKLCLCNYLPEAGAVILVGVAAGYLASLSDSKLTNNGISSSDNSINSGLVSFSSNIFFLLILPPIIFNAGYHINRDLFFPLFVPITMLAVIGTTVSCISIATILYFAVDLGLTGSFKPSVPELLAFGGLISATDPVSTLAVFSSKRCDPTLFYLVFGESVLNDAVGLVLYDVLAKFVGTEPNSGSIVIAFVDFFIIFFGSTALGLFCGVASALLFKMVDMRKTPLVEICVFSTVVYLPVCVAEVLGMSGIVTVLFTSIVTNCYSTRNISPMNAANADVIFRLLAHLAETSVFLMLGLAVFGLDNKGNYHNKFILWSFAACLIGRVFNVYPIFGLCNLFSNGGCGSQSTTKTKETKGLAASNFDLESSSVSSSINDDDPLIHNKGDGPWIPSKTQHMLFFSGLRGAVAFACVTSFPNDHGNRDAFIMTTMVIIFATVFLLGGPTGKVLEALDIDVEVDEEKYLSEQ